MIELRTISTIVAAYIPDGEDLYGHKEQIHTTQDWDQFLPVIEHAGKNISSTIDLLNMKARERSIRSYNRNMTIQSIPSEQLAETKLDVSVNELTLGSQKYILNLTQSAITIIDSDAIPKVYLPLENTSLTAFAGSILIIEITNLNNKEIVSAYGGTDNYLGVYESLLERHKVDKTIAYKASKIFQMANDLYNKLEYNKVQPRSNSIKVVGVKEIKGEYIVDLNNGKTIFDKEFSITISMNNLMNVRPNPVTTTNYKFQVALNCNDRINSVQAFINDPDDDIDDRYLAVGPDVIKIPKIKDPSEEPMFKMIIHVEDGKETKIEEPLHEIDNLPYIYTSKEEARIGMSKDRLYEKELAEKRIKSELTKLSINDSIEAQRIELEKEKREWDRERRHLEKVREETLNSKAEESLKLELKKNELEKERELMKLQMLSYNHDRTRENETMKFHYDVQRANKDTTLQTLKVVGGVVALGAAAFAVYKKLS